MAREDLHAIVRYVAKDNPARAKSFGKDLRNKTKALVQQPKPGRAGRPGLPEYVRELVVHPNYIVFYRVLAEAGIVQILRMKHAAQQIP